MEAYRPTSYSTLNTAENCVHKQSQKTLLQDITVTLYVALVYEPDFRRPIHSVMVSKHIKIKLYRTIILPAF